MHQSLQAGHGPCRLDALTLCFCLRSMYETLEGRVWEALSTCRCRARWIALEAILFLILLIVELWEGLRRYRELPGAQEPCASGQCRALQA